MQLSFWPNVDLDIISNRNDFNGNSKVDYDTAPIMTLHTMPGQRMLSDKYTSQITGGDWGRQNFCVQRCGKNARKCCLSNAVSDKLHSIKRPGNDKGSVVLSLVEYKYLFTKDF